MTKNITLTIGERLAALKILDGFKGTISDLAVILDDVKKLAISAEEWEKAGRVITQNGDNQSWKWNEEDVATHKEVELRRETVNYIAKTIKEKSDKNEVTLADVALISLNKKIE